MDGGGRELSHDLLLEALEGIEISFNQDGTPNMPTIVVSPGMGAKIRALPPETEDQMRRFNEMMDRKKREWFDRRRTRRLSFEVWDREWFVEVLSRRPDLALSGGVTDAFFGQIGDIAIGNATVDSLERFSRSWLDPDGQLPRRLLLSGAMLAVRLRSEGRMDLAAFEALLMLRAITWHSHTSTGLDPGELAAIADTVGGLFSEYADNLAATCAIDPSDTIPFLGDGREVAIWVTYPARCLRTTEILSLHALRLVWQRDPMAPDAEQLVCDLVRHQPGARHPISESWASALIPTGLVLARSDSDLFEEWLTEVTRWTCDFYDNGPGLAIAGASPDVEVDYLLGGPFEHVNLSRQSACSIATALLDLTSVCERGDLYELVLNEFLAVDAVPIVVEVNDTPDQYLRDGAGVRRQANDPFDPEWAPVDGWKNAHHHRRSPKTYWLLERAREWDHLAAAAVAADRWFLPTMRRFLWM